MSKFTNLNNKYEDAKKIVVDTLIGLASHCNEITTNHPELFGEEDIDNSHPFEISYNEKYDSHSIYNGKVYLWLSYEDSYDEICNTESELSFPIEWVDLWMDNKVEELNLLVSAAIKEDNLQATRRYKLDTLHKAMRAGILTEEEYDKKRREILV